MTDYDVLTLD